MSRKCKSALDFARASKISRFEDAEAVNPNEFTDTEKKEYEVFKREQRKSKQAQYNKRSYTKMKSENRVQRQPPVAQMSADRVDRQREVRRRSSARVKFRKLHPEKSPEEIEELIDTTQQAKKERAKRKAEVASSNL